MGLARFTITLTAAIFGLYGLAFVFAPETMSLQVTGSVPATPSASIDMRSTYGGMNISLALLLASTARDPSLYALGLRGVVLFNASMASSRVLGIVLDGAPNAVMWLFLGLEVFAIALATFALRKL